MATGENRFHSTEIIWAKPWGEMVIFFIKTILDLLLSFNGDAREEFEQHKMNTVKVLNPEVIS